MNKQSKAHARPELADSGGHFYRTDFQVHTPRDTQWDGVRPQGEPERTEWARSLIRAARARGLQALAVSDHHDFTMFPYVREAAEQEFYESNEAVPPRDRITVFPALELTLSVPCQAILILDVEFPQDRLNDVLKALHCEPIDPSLSTLPQATVLPHSGDINDLHDTLNKHAWLRGRYIILPNVSPGGYKTLLRTSFQAKYRDMVCVGGYLDGSVAELEKPKRIGDARILAGGDSNWGSKRLALFQTSDARTADFAHLGEHSTWVKWARPTAEAIRQACLAQESRIAQTEPEIANVWISRFVVSTSKFMGRVDLALNPEYTALIGGRGTGKSTILDYLRWALCDQPAQASEDDEVADPRVRQRKLVEATLKPSDAHVEVHCSINGIAHIVRRHASSGDVHLKVGEAEFERVREPVIQSLLPIQAYSQKQLSSVAIRVDELVRFITTPIQRVLEDVDRKYQEVTGRLRENYGTLQRFRALSSDIERSKLRIASLSDQAQALRDGLAGISAEDRQVLDEKAAYEEVKASIAIWLQQVEAAEVGFANLARSLADSIAKISTQPNAPTAVRLEMDYLNGRILAMLEAAKAEVVAGNQKIADLARGEGAVRVATDSLTARVEAFDAAYAAVKSRSTAHEAKLRELGSLEEQQRAARDLLRKQESELSSLGDPLSKHAELRLELSLHGRQRSKALKDQCAQLSESSDGLIRATLSMGTGFGVAQSKLKALITGSNVRGTKIDVLFEQLPEELDPVATWESVLAELESLVLLEPDSEIRSEQFPVIARLGIGVPDLKKIAPRVTPDGWLDLSLALVADHPVFEYRSKEDVYIPFSAASAGQQASALLTTLLSQDGTPLVIDQPEDDLDSNTVQQIVSKIWASKRRRQLIFSSHNANLVVNGDADLVLVCAYTSAGDQSAGHIKLEGAIDIDEVRSEITSVMEGGERAFKLRKEKYGF